MSADVFTWLCCGFVLLLALWAQLVNRHLDRQNRRLRLLTRRVWILEGRNPANADQAERELDAEDQAVRA